MVTHNIFSFVITFAFCLCNLSFSIDVNNDLKDYIVYLGSTSNDEYLTTSQHINILQQVVQDRTAQESIIRSYKRSFSGFAAKLTYKEYETLKSMDNVLSIFPSRTLQIQTTRSWDFIGLPQPSPRQQDAESDVIVGVIDTGIWPELPSFNDDGLAPIPKKWKGHCDGGKNFTCNKKLIGAKTYVPETARDRNGHGTHTASIAAGRVVGNTSFYGIANGTARGGVPSARIAAYKVCNLLGCKERDLLAAFDDAIAEGVDLITISICGDPIELDQDSIAISAFHAAQKGILTVQSAGNSRSQGGSVGSVAPWIFTVAASSIDRRIINKVDLGNGKTLIGSAVNGFTMNGTKIPLVYGKGASNTCDEETAQLCVNGCLDRSLVQGKIVVCNSTDTYNGALERGALGVVGQSGIVNVSFVYPLPGIGLLDSEFSAVYSYITSTKSPTANILRSETITDKDAPTVAGFSSRGPNTIASDILKPDITAPGVDILAGYSPEASPSEAPYDKRSVKYNVLSGTSVSCPHVAGAAAYLKSVHPNWSPAAIKSALMTTADPMSPSRNSDAEFAYGSGHLNLVKAANPGLVYNATQNDYIAFLCNDGYTKIGVFTGNNSATCPKKNTQSPKDVNYPSMSALVTVDKSFSLTFSRTVTNVGVANSTYTSEVKSDSKIQVKVEPSTLSFKSLQETKSFNVTVVGKISSANSQASASLIWTDGIHRVRSPIVVYTVPNSAYTAEVKFRRKVPVKVEPSSLSFTSLKETKSFVVTVSGRGFEPARLISASLVWNDGVHSVRSPIVIYTLSL